MFFQNKIVLGSSFATLDVTKFSAQRTTLAGANVGAPMTTTFVHLGNGTFLFSNNTFPDGERGGLKYSNDGTQLAEDDYAPAAGETSVDPGGALPIEIDVKLPDNTPAAGASVTLISVADGTVLSRIADNAGAAAFTVHAGFLYRVAATSTLSILDPQTITASAADSPYVFLMTEVPPPATPPVPPTPSQCVGTTRVVDGQGTPIVGAVLTFELKDGPGLSAGAYSDAFFTALSGDGGIANVTFLKSAKYRGRLEPNGTWRGFTTPASSDNFNLPEFISSNNAG